MEMMVYAFILGICFIVAEFLYTNITYRREQANERKLLARKLLASLDKKEIELHTIELKCPFCEYIQDTIIYVSKHTVVGLLTPKTCRRCHEQYYFTPGDIAPYKLIDNEQRAVWDHLLKENPHKRRKP